jgi:hypothetical protein
MDYKMNYKRLYDSLIERGKQREIVDGLYEKHHIVPRCLGGDDSKANLVKLTSEEHYVAHQLLVKLYPKNPRIVNAAAMMIPNRPSNKMYGWLKRKHQQAMKEMQQGSNNSQYGKRWIHSLSLKQSKRINKSDPLPEGWNEGRKLDFIERKLSCRFCKKEFVQGRLEIYCSGKCKQYNHSPAIYIIDNNLEDMVSKFCDLGSITAVLNSYGIQGRQGNVYFSKILKKRNMQILKRRNSF